MTKSELMELVGKKVRIICKDGDEDVGILKYVDEFSEKHGWRKPNYFYINGCNFCFKVRHIKKVEVLG